MVGLVDDAGALVESYVYDPYETAYVWQDTISGEPGRVSIALAIECEELAVVPVSFVPASSCWE